MKERLGYIDAIKGVAIFLMVMGHVLAWTYAPDFEAVKNSGPYSATFWWRVIYAFHMPLFFCVSGFLFGGVKNVSFSEGGQLIWKRVRSLLIPFLCVGLLFHFTTGGSIEKYWFLRSLFIATSINVLYEMVKSKLNLGMVYDGLFYCVSFCMLYFAGKVLKGTLVDDVVDFGHFASFNYLAFCLGIIIRRFDRIRAIVEDNRAYSFCLGLFVLLLFPQLPVPKIIRSFLMCFSGVICVWYMMKNVFTSNPVVNFLEKMGRHSLDIYLIHFFLNISIVEVGKYFISLAEGGTYFPILTGCMLQVMFGVVVSFLICICCLVISKIVGSSKIFVFCLKGKL